LPPSKNYKETEVQVFQLVTTVYLKSEDNFDNYRTVWLKVVILNVCIALKTTVAVRDLVLRPNYLITS